MRGFNQYQGAKQELEIRSLDIVPSKEMVSAGYRKSRNGLMGLQETCQKGKSEEGEILAFESYREERLMQLRADKERESVEQSLDYKKVKGVLEEIREYFSYPQFTDTYGENADNILRLVDNILDGLERQDEERLIRKSLCILKGITAGTSDTMIGAGVLVLLGSLPIEDGGKEI